MTLYPLKTSENHRFSGAVETVHWIKILSMIYHKILCLQYELSTIRFCTRMISRLLLIPLICLHNQLNLICILLSRIISTGA